MCNTHLYYRRNDLSFPIVNIPLSQSCGFHISWILISGIYISQLILYLYIVVNTKNGHQKHTEHMLRALTYDWTVKYEWKDSLHYISLHLGWGPSWSWSYGSWIYNYLWNQCLSPLKLWVRTPFMARCTRYNIMWHSISVTSDRSVVFSWYSSFLHQ